MPRALRVLPTTKLSKIERLFIVHMLFEVELELPLPSVPFKLNENEEPTRITPLTENPELNMVI